MPVATGADVALVLRRDLTNQEQAVIARRIQAATGVLEGLLHRTLELDAWHEHRVPLPMDTWVAPSADTGWSTLTGRAAGTVALAHRPVGNVNAVKVGDRDITAACVVRRDVLYVPTLDPVDVEYTAGDDPVAPQITELVARAVARALLVPPQAAAGVPMNYSVEGTSITYGETQAATDPSTAPFTGEEIRALRASLGRLVIR